MSENTITTAVCEIAVTPDEDSAIVEISHYGVTDVEFTLDPEQREELALMLVPHYSRLETENEDLRNRVEDLTKALRKAADCLDHVGQADIIKDSRVMYGFVGQNLAEVIIVLGEFPEDES